MMRKIFKYPFLIKDEQIIRMPIGFRVIHVGLDPSNNSCIWAEVDPRMQEHDCHVFVRGTGHDVPVAMHCGSFNDGPFMWHVYTYAGRTE